MVQVNDIPKDKYDFLKKLENEHIEFTGFEKCDLGIKPIMKIKESTDSIFEAYRTSEPQDVGSVILALQTKLIELQIAEYKRDIENSKGKNGKYPSQDPIDRRESLDKLYSYSRDFVSEMIQTKLYDSVKLAA